MTVQRLWVSNNAVQRLLLLDRTQTFAGLARSSTHASPSSAMCQMTRTYWASRGQPLQSLLGPAVSCPFLQMSWHRSLNLQPLWLRADALRLYLQACLYTCMHSCRHVRTHAHAHTHARTHPRKHPRTNIHTLSLAHAHAHARPYSGAVLSNGTSSSVLHHLEGDIKVLKLDEHLKDARRWQFSESARVVANELNAGLQSLNVPASVSIGPDIINLQANSRFSSADWFEGKVLHPMNLSLVQGSPAVVQFERNMRLGFSEARVLMNDIIDVLSAPTAMPLQLIVDPSYACTAPNIAEFLTKYQVPARPCACLCARSVNSK